MMAEAIRSRCGQGKGTEGIQNGGHREALQAKARESRTQSGQRAQGGKEKQGASVDAETPTRQAHRVKTTDCHTISAYIHLYCER